jgi:hypothetical protein
MGKDLPSPLQRLTVLISGYWILILERSKKSLRMSNKKLIIFAVLSILVQTVITAQTDGEAIIIGKYRKLYSKITGEERTLLIRLPRSYGDSQTSYPVYYLLYGQNINEYFMPTISACNMLDGTGAIPEIIVVGMANAEQYRDYSSISDGYIANTVKFFTEELFPFIQNNYRIVVGPQAGGHWTKIIKIIAEQILTAVN